MQARARFILSPTMLLHNVRVTGKGLMGEVAKGDAGMDCVLAALHLASEDDAIKTRTHIPLPVDSFSGRLDTVVAVRAL